ncbi:MAG: universal stress protein [Acidobacteriota bacterium]|nr:universal stress protein [Acidobacteriota bacterium]
MPDEPRLCEPGPMTSAGYIAIAVAALVVGLFAGSRLPQRRSDLARRREPGSPVRRILLPFTGTFIPRRSFEAAIRLAKAEDAILMPAFLARVPMNLPLTAPLPGQCAEGMPLLEVIEQRALAQGVEVDSRVARGRTARDALRNLLAQEDFDRIIVSAGQAADQPAGMSEDDIVWLLENVPAEIMILRPAPEDMRRIATDIVGTMAL